MPEELKEPVEQRAPAPAPAPAGASAPPHQPRSHDELVRDTEAIVRRLAELNEKSQQLAHQNQLLKRRLQEITQRAQSVEQPDHSS